MRGCVLREPRHEAFQLLKNVRYFTIDSFLSHVIPFHLILPVQDKQSSHGRQSAGG